FYLGRGKDFTFKDLNLASHFNFSKDGKKEFCPWFAKFLKTRQNSPFVIIGTNSNGNVLYRKTETN
ncbi:cassette chromosome ssDNA-binding protein, partial [Staphylococcus simulans]